jgi:hypothetical protein
MRGSEAFWWIYLSADRMLKTPDEAIAMASVHGIQFLLTGNCKHIANPEHRPKIERACRDLGIEPPLIGTPFDLLEN